MEVNNDIIKLIQSKVSLYKNRKYFKLFKDIFISCTMNFLKNPHYISSKNNNNDKLENIIFNKHESDFYWQKIMKNIYISQKVKPYDLKKSLLMDDEYHLNPKEKGENICYRFSEYNKRYEINNLVYLYLCHLSKINLQKLNIISKKEKTPLTNIARIYLFLCAQSIGILGINKKKDIKRTINENISSRKNLTTELNLNLKDDIIKKENNPKNKKKTEKNSKLNDCLFQIKYISNLKSRMAKMYNNSRKKEKNKNSLEKNRNNVYNGTLNDRPMKKEELEKKKDEFSDEFMNEEFLKSIKNYNKKGNNSSLKMFYSSSFTRLFIGETDIDSIRERYLSNIDVKKDEKIERMSKKMNSSDNYLKKFASRIIQNSNNQLPLIEKSMESILTKFKKNQEMIEKFKRLCAEEGLYAEKEKENINEKYDYDFNIKKSINIECKNDKNKILDLKIDLNDINKNYNFISLSSNKNKGNEIMKTPERKKEIEKIDFIKSNKNNIVQNNKKNLSFNRKGNKDIFRLNKINNINENTNKDNNKLFHNKYKNELFINNDHNAFLTERNNSNKKSRFKKIFEKKLFRNKYTNLNNNIFYYNKNLIYRGDKNLYDKNENTKYQKTKNFFTKKDFYF